LKSTEQLAKEIIKNINEDNSELCRFIDFIKIYGLAIKIAFRCDRGVAWELLGKLLREFEKIGMYRKKYDEKIDDIAKRIKTRSSGSLNRGLENIIEEANKLREELEKYHIEVNRERRKNQIR
jgi:hypothetical protein